MLTYNFTYRRRFGFFKKTISGARLHQYMPATNKMWVDTINGGFEIRNWSNCEAYLGKDWAAYIEKYEAERLSSLNISGPQLV
ncbi:MAG: hypothetical protein EOP06_02365 [Proteobacteria bacterium]|nr:MAG: hypothetical protein EOP06_02365 [Pseudomonadota bacterium]